MKRLIAMQHVRPQSRKRQAKNRRGSTIIVVIGLMGLLLVLGFFAYTFAKQSNESSQYYANSAKQTKVPTVDPELIFDEAIKQLLLGPGLNKPNSALAGGYVSMVPNLLGHDMHPHNGIGFEVLLDSTSGRPYIDLDQDGKLDADDDIDGNGGADLLRLNHSPSAEGVANSSIGNYPYPDAGYTYPDAMSLFLAYNGYGLDANNRPVHVIIPSFHRPQYLRFKSGTQIPYRRDYDRLANTKLLSLRPHAEHLDMSGTLTTATSRGYRFLHANHSDFSTTYNSDTSLVFPFNEGDFDGNGTFDTGEDVDSDGAMDGHRQGVWDLAGWQASTFYSQYDWIYVIDSGTIKYFQKTDIDAEKSGSSAPNWSLGVNVGDQVTDGAVTWTLYNYTAGYEYDADPDGDGIKEAIWLDLDLPLQEVGGVHVIPLVAFTVYDADGLFNMNIHGNTFADDGTADPSQPSSSTPFGNGQYISRSNLGMSNPAEVNPQYAFNADPTNDMPFDSSSQYGATALTPTKAFKLHNSIFAASSHFGASTTDTELSNTEFWFALKGRPIYSGTNIVGYIPGRHGELDLTDAGYTSLNGSDFPYAGTTTTDDNPAATTDANLLTGHPLDYAGIGSSTQLSGGVYKKLFNTSNLIPLPSYTSYYDSGSTVWSAATGLMTSSTTVGLSDEPLETILDDQFAASTTTSGGQALKDIIAADEPFEAAEMFSLHASNTDRIKTGTTSRLLDLMPWMLKNNTRASDIRKRLATASWDFALHGRTYAGPDGTAEDEFRPWEFQLNASSEYEFPPQVPTANLASGASQPFRNEFRALLKMHADDRTESLTFESVDSKSLNVLEQRLLNINRVLHYVDNNANLYYDDSDDLKYHRLTTHPSDPGAAVLSQPSDFPTYPPGSGSNADLEWWARYDRQQLARDIYVLLYLIGGGEDDINYLTTANSVANAGTGERDLYDEYQLREMAQFAVNIVDALDPDDHITKFEYDKDLSDGWGLDNNPYTNSDDPGTVPTLVSNGFNPRYPEDSDQRGVVYGIEAQSLTLSEFIGVYAPQVLDGSSNPYDHPATRHNDSVANGNYFTYLELRNVSPFAVDFSQEHWQIRVLPQQDSADRYKTDGSQSTPATAERRLQITSGASAPARNLFTVGISTYTTNEESVLHVDESYDLSAGGTPTWGASTQKIPKSGAVSLDLNASANSGKFSIEDGVGTTKTALLDSNNADITNTKYIEVALYRRAHLTRTSPTNAAQEVDNPWVEVDRMVIEPISGNSSANGGMRVFDIAYDTDASSSPTMTTKLQALQSRFRKQPLARNQTSANGWDIPDSLTGNETDTAAAVQANSINANDSSQTTAFTLWQPHFDRQFSSVFELLSIPLYRPDEVTAKLSTDNGTSIAVTDIFTSAAKILRPEHIANVDAEFPGKGKGLSKGKGKGKGQTQASGNVPKRNNRWHRIFSFIQVPSRADTHAALAGDLGRSLVPGKINLNTIRYPEILAGLIDDTTVFTFNELRPSLSPGQTAYLTDSVETSRDWWVQFIHARDQLDSDVTGMYLPGMPRKVIDATDRNDYLENLGSRPFHDLTYVARGVDSIHHTILRGLPTDLGVDPTTDKGTDTNVAPRQLFQLGTWAQQNLDNVDYHTRYKILSKIAGNTTTRSHIFYAFVEIGFFQAFVDASTGHVRIGAELEDAPRHRGFFVIDTTKALEEIQPNPDTMTDVHFRNDIAQGFSIISRDENSSTGFDHNKLILYKQIIE